MAEAISSSVFTAARSERSVAGRLQPLATWRGLYTLQMVISDGVCSVLALLLGNVFGIDGLRGRTPPNLVVIDATVTLVWLLALQVARAYEVRNVSVGAEEYKRMMRGTALLVGALAFVCYVGDTKLARHLLIVVIPFGFVLHCVARYVGRKTVHARRKSGRWCSQILVIGTRESVRDLVAVTRRAPYAGLVVVGACIDDDAVGAEVAAGVPILGSIAEAALTAAAVDADVVALAGSGMAARGLRELGWQLEGTGRDLVMAPGLTEVAGPRVHVSPVEGLPLMWVDQPQFTGLSRIMKRVLDIVGALLLIVLASPVFLLAAILVRLTSHGPALYRHTRLGQYGGGFTVYKFRSMYDDADRLRAGLLDDNEADGGLLFKIRRDPRVTPVGRILRKFSLDELPQLLNVLGGSMSLVGPRPPLPEEVERYHTDVRRRLLVKPGMTGLWQVSGRSDLSWDEAVRLDLYYVENWSLPLDLVIIARTVWAVFRSRGAY